jgi:hypothetical protein
MSFASLLTTLLLLPLVASVPTTTTTLVLRPPAITTIKPSPTTSHPASACPCGYVDDQKNRWVCQSSPFFGLVLSGPLLQRESIQSNFMASQGALAVVNQDWDVQTWFGQGRALGQQRSAANVYQYNGLLALRTSAYNGTGTVYTGQINTKVCSTLVESRARRALIALAAHGHPVRHFPPPRRGAYRSRRVHGLFPVPGRKRAGVRHRASFRRPKLCTPSSLHDAAARPCQCDTFWHGL